MVEAVKKQPFFLLKLGLLLILVFLLITPLQKNYVFVSNNSDKVEAYLPLDEFSFQIEYTHTIHRSQVVESYKVLEDNSFLVTELEYEDFNIGMPSNAGEGETFIEKEGKYYIKNMNRKMADFRLFIGDVDADLSFLTDSRKFDLKKALERGNSYTVKVQRLSLIQQLIGVKLDEQESAA